MIMPQWWASILSRVRGLFSQSKADRELSDEIETHVELLAERFVSRGMSQTEATGYFRIGGDTTATEKSTRPQCSVSISAGISQLRFCR